jgi:hypothetical protein
MKGRKTIGSFRLVDPTGSPMPIELQPVCVSRETLRCLQHATGRNPLCATPRSNDLRAAGHNRVDRTCRSRVVLIDAGRLGPQADFRWATWHIRP